MSNEWSSTFPETPGWYVVIGALDDLLRPSVARVYKTQSGRLMAAIDNRTRYDVASSLLWFKLPDRAEDNAPATGLPDRTQHKLTEAVRALEKRTDTLTGLVRDLTRRVKVLEGRQRVSPKRKARATKGGAPGGAA